MSNAAATSYQGILQRLQSLVTPTSAPMTPAPAPGVPAVQAPPLQAPTMGADTFVRTIGFPLPPNGAFLPGHFGPLVGALQSHLSALGYLAGTPDQQYAHGTIEAVKYFQMEYGLPVTGLFDQTSLQTMMAVFSGQLPWMRAPRAAQPDVTVAPQTPPQTPPQAAAVQNPLGVDWVTGPPPAAQAPAPQPPAPQPAPKPESKPESKPAPKAEPKPDPKPAPKAEPKPAPKPEPKASSDQKAIEALKKMTPAELTRLGATDKKKFFEVLRPAAEESERKHGVPAAVTLAQAALETGWGKSIIPGYNIFGIKGKGPAGTVSKKTWEHYNGKDVTITANFAKYHNFYEAVSEHGKRFHNGYYNKALNAYKQNPDPFLFARNITGIYATDPKYGDKLISIMKTYGLV